MTCSLDRNVSSIGSNGGCTWTCITDGISLLFLGATVPLYILVIICLIRYSKELNGAFFTLCISTGLSDLCYIFTKNFTRKIPRILFYNYFRESERLATVSSICGWYGFYVSITGVFLLSTNRLTALAFPLRHQPIWTDPRVLRSAILVQWLWPIIFALPMFMPAFAACYDDSLNPRFQDLQVFILMPAFICMYAFMFYKAVRYSENAMSSQSESEAHKLELRLATIGAVLSIIYILLCMCYICFAFHVRTVFVSLAFFYLTDLLFAANPWLLLLSSKLLRKCFGQMLRHSSWLPHKQASVTPTAPTADGGGGVLRRVSVDIGRRLSNALGLTPGGTIDSVDTAHARRISVTPAPLRHQH